jgi:cysteine desulfurase
MARRSIYLDYNATQPVKPQVGEAMLRALCEPANPSSVHQPGQRARRIVENARSDVAALIGARAADVVFTASATEANATALGGVVARAVLVSAIEHPSVGDAPTAARIIPVDRDGVVDLAALDRMLAEAAGPALVSVMLVNNETGVIQPVADAARIAHAHGALIHTDAAQAPGRIAIAVNALDVDLLTVSAHKIGGPHGAGALYIRGGLALRPLLRGGGQEGRRRAGTENVAAIAGFGVAARLALDDLAAAARIERLRTRMENGLLTAAPALVIHGRGAQRVCNTSCFGVHGLPAETALIALDLAGIAVSSGAACSSGAVEPSRVLLAMGAPENTAREAVRVSLGWATTEDEIDQLVEHWAMVYRRSMAAPTGSRGSRIEELLS